MQSNLSCNRSKMPLAHNVMSHCNSSHIVKSTFRKNSSEDIFLDSPDSFYLTLPPYIFSDGTKYYIFRFCKE